MIKTFQTNDGIDEHKFGYQRVIRHCFTHISTFQETHNYRISYLGFVRRLKLIGFLIGVITGTVFLLLLKTAVNPSERGGPLILILTAEILALPAFWFGGSWLAGGLLKETPLDNLIDSYAISLAITFMVMVSYPASRWIIHLGKTIGAGGE
jgi:hypothetical protein